MEDRSIELVSYAISHENGNRYLEGLFSFPGTEEGPKEFVQFRISISPEGYPRIPEALLEGLKNVRGLIAGEIQKISTRAPFDF